MNRLLEETCPKKWERIQEFVQTILSTEKKTILKAWEKTKLKADFDFDRELVNQNVEEEFLLKIKMDELINDEGEATEEYSENVEEPVLVFPPISAEKKEAKQSQITDFFKSTK